MLSGEYVKQDYLTALEERITALENVTSNIQKQMTLKCFTATKSDASFNIPVASRGVALVGSFANGRTSEELWVLGFNNSNSGISTSTRLSGTATSTLSFSMSNGILNIVCSVQWTVFWVLTNNANT